MKDIVLNIKSTQKIDGDFDSSEFMCEGKYEEKDEFIKLIYSESVALGVEGITSIITVDKNNIVTLSRTGALCSDFIVEPGKRHLCQYQTEYGDMMIGISGDRVVNRIKEKGELTLKYSIDVNSGLLSENEMKIKISEDVPNVINS